MARIEISRSSGLFEWILEIVDSLYLGIFVWVLQIHFKGLEVNELEDHFTGDKLWLKWFISKLQNLLIYQMILPHIPVFKILLKPHSREHRLRYCHHFIPFTLGITAETFSFLSKKQTPFCPTLQTNITLVQVWQEESPSLQSENKLIFIITAFELVLLFIYPSLSSHLPSFIILPINLSFKTLSHTLHPVKRMVCLFTHPVLICLTLMISHSKAEHRSPPYLLCTVPRIFSVFVISVL